MDISSKSSGWVLKFKHTEHFDFLRVQWIDILILLHMKIVLLILHRDPIQNINPFLQCARALKLLAKKETGDGQSPRVAAFSQTKALYPYLGKAWERCFLKWQVLISGYSKIYNLLRGWSCRGHVFWVAEKRRIVFGDVLMHNVCFVGLRDRETPLRGQ